MIERQEFKRLITFKVVYELQSFSKASDYLMKSQPAISTTIKQLELQLNVSLFERNQKHGIQPTESAHILYKKVNKLLEIWNDTIYRINEISNRNVFCTIGASTSTSMDLLPGFLVMLNKSHPNIDFKVKVDLSEHLYTDIMNKDIDLALVEISVTQNKHIIVIPLFYDELVLAGDFESNTWLLNTTRTSINQANETYMLENSITPANYVHVNSNPVLIELLSRGVGCSVVSLDSIKDMNIPYKRLGKKYIRQVSLLIASPPALIFDEF